MNDYIAILWTAILLGIGFVLGGGMVIAFVLFLIYSSHEFFYRLRRRHKKLDH